jgi:hypothetical protein
MPTWDLESLLALVRTVCIEKQRRKFSNSELYVQVQLIGAQSFQGGPEPEFKFVRRALDLQFLRGSAGLRLLRSPIDTAEAYQYLQACHRSSCD